MTEEKLFLNNGFQCATHAIPFSRALFWLLLVVWCIFYLQDIHLYYFTQRDGEFEYLVITQSCDLENYRHKVQNS